MPAVLNRIARYLGYVPASSAAQSDAWSSLYAVNEALYDNSAYNTEAFASSILERYIGQGYGDPQKYPLYPFFMPFREIVDTYLNVFPGTWGDLLKPVTVDGEGELDSRFADALDGIWKRSGLDTSKQTFVRWSGNFGTVGIRPWSRPGVENKPSLPAITFDHPRHLYNFEEDANRNVTAVCLKYQKTVNAGTLADPKWETVDVVEEITKDDYSRKVDGTEEIEDSERRNTLGFCPYVIHRFRENGTPRGDWAYKGSESVVHRINWRISRQDRSIDRHQFPKWFGAGAGDKPDTVDMGDTKMSWVKLHPDSPPPLLQAIVAQVDQAAAQAFWMSLRDELRGRQPELNLNDVKLLSTISGETIAQVLTPTKQAILSVRPGFDHALIRAMQMAVSVGIANGSVDIGVGSGPDAADKAYREGKEDFAFADRPALPETPQQQLVKAQASTAEASEKFKLASQAANAGVSAREQLRISGYTDVEIATIEGEVALDKAQEAIARPSGGAAVAR